MDQSDVLKVKDLVTQASEILIVTHEHPTADSIGSSLALFIALSNLGKKVTVACPDVMTVEFSGFVGVNKIVSEVGKKNFVISLDYVEGSIEKVSYNIAGNTFNLVIEPRVGFPPFSEDKAHFSQQGASGDLIIAVDSIHLGGLKKLYEENKELFANKPVINIDRHSNNVRFGQVNMVDSQASSTAELIGQLLTALELPMTEDIATNLLNALYGATNSFQSQFVTAAAFSLAGVCMQAGGKRFRKAASSQEEPKADAAPAPVAPVAPVAAAPVVPEVPKAATATQNPTMSPTSTQAAPADWLKPKIFKSSNLL